MAILPSVWGVYRNTKLWQSVWGDSKFVYVLVISWKWKHFRQVPKLCIGFKEMRTWYEKTVLLPQFFTNSHEIWHRFAWVHTLMCHGWHTLFMSVCVCMSVCMYVCMYAVYACIPWIYTCMYVISIFSPGTKTMHCLCMYVCIHVCMYVCTCMYMYVCTHMYVYIHVCMYTCVYICTCMYVCVCVCTCECVCVCVCVNVFKCSCVWVYSIHCILFASMCACVCVCVCVCVQSVCVCLYDGNGWMQHQERNKVSLCSNQWWHQNYKGWILGWGKLRGWKYTQPKK